jgi:DNA-binding IclR family transcriptional regulator
VPVPAAPGRIAISVSGPQARIGEEQIARMVPALQAVADELGRAAAEYQ